MRSAIASCGSDDSGDAQSADSPVKLTIATFNEFGYEDLISEWNADSSTASPVYKAGNTAYLAAWTAKAIDQQIPIAGGTFHLVLPNGPYLRVEGIGIQLTVAGQTLSGDFTTGFSPLPKFRNANTMLPSGTNWSFNLAM